MKTRLAMLVCLTLTRSISLGFLVSIDIVNAQPESPKIAGVSAVCGQPQTACRVGDILTIKFTDKAAAAIAGIATQVRWGTPYASDTLNWTLESNWDAAAASGVAVLAIPRDASGDAIAGLLRTYPSHKLPLAVVIVKDGRTLYEAPITLDVTSMYDSKQWGLDISSVDCTHDLLGRCTFGEYLTLGVPSYPQWIEVTKTDPTKLQLLLDGLALDGVPPVQSCSQLVGGGPCTILFHLVRDPANEKNITAWRHIITKLNGRNTTLDAAIGTEGRATGKPGTFVFDVQRVPILEVILYLVLLAILFVVACRSNLTRDTTLSNLYPVIADKHCRGPYKNPASLAKTQMTLWTIIVFFSFIYLWLVSWDLNTMNTTALALLGLSAGTAVGARLVDTTSTASLTLSASDKQWLADLAMAGKTLADAEANAPVNPATVELARQAVFAKWQQPPVR
jgi:hypothetical protein